MALPITIVLSFLFGGLAQVAWQRAFRTFNAGTLGGAVLATLAGLLAFGLCLLLVARIGRTYSRPNDGVVLGSFLAGVTLIIVIQRLRGGRRQTA